LLAVLKSQTACQIIHASAYFLSVTISALYDCSVTLWPQKILLVALAWPSYSLLINVLLIICDVVSATAGAVGPYSAQYVFHILEILPILQNHLHPNIFSTTKYVQSCTSQKCCSNPKNISTFIFDTYCSSFYAQFNHQHFF